MKKTFLLVFVVFILVGCNKLDISEFNQYIKNDIVIENGSIIKPEDLFDLSKDNSITKKINSSELVIDYNKNKSLNEIKDNIIAENIVEVTYQEGNKKSILKVPVRIKDTIKPVLQVKNPNLVYLLGDEFSTDILLDDIGVDVSDSSNTNIVLEGVEKINIEKAKIYYIRLVVKDSANNSVEKNIKVSVLKPEIKHDFPFYNNIDKETKGSVQSFYLIIPSEYVTFNKVIISKRDYLEYDNENAYTQKINLGNGLNMMVSSAFRDGKKDKCIRKYRIKSFEIGEYKGLKGKYNVLTYGKSSLRISMEYDASKIKYKEANRIFNEIIENSYVK